MTRAPLPGKLPEWPPLEPRFRYRIQQDQGKYCLKRCDDGDLIDYDEHKLVVSGWESRARLMAADLENIARNAWPTESIQQIAMNSLKAIGPLPEEDRDAQ